MRDPSNYPNRRHTPETMRDELTAAHRMGKPQEITDLALLIQNAERPKGARPLPGAAQARNRQGMRRFNREKLPAGVSYDNPRRTQVLVTDWVEDPAGARWRVSRIVGDTAWYDVPDKPTINCPVKLLRIVNGPHAPTPAPSAPALPPASNGRAEAAEALYQATWDVLDKEDGSSWREALERALRAYESTTT